MRKVERRSTLALLLVYHQTYNWSRNKCSHVARQIEGFYISYFSPPLLSFVKKPVKNNLVLVLFHRVQNPKTCEQGTFNMVTTCERTCEKKNLCNTTCEKTCES